MNIFKIIYETAIEALFPLSEIEKELFLFPLSDISKTLPPAPNYSGLAVPLPESSSLFAYKDKRVEQLIWNIKYKKSRRAVEIGGYALFRYLFSRFGGTDFQDTPSTLASVAASSRMPTHPPKCPSNSVPPPLYILILPMPITKQRQRERGYNQCELLTNEMKRLYLEHETKNTSGTHLLFENDLLIRTHHDSRHTLKGRTDRVESAKGIFGVNESIIKRLGIDGLKDYRIIIVDDVITTGSTMREAIDTMKKSGFTNVSGLSVAH